LQAELHQLRVRIQWTTRLTALVALALLALLCGYFYYAAGLWAEVTQPDRLLDLAEAKIQETLPGMRESLEKQITTDAPRWAEGLSKQALAALPDARQRFETFAVDKLKESIDEVRLMGVGEFRKFVTANRPVLEQHIEDLARNPRAAERSLDAFIAAFEKDQQANMKNDMGELVKTLKECNEHWRYLRVGKDLDEEGRLERRVLMLARRLQLDLAEREAAVPRKVAAPESPRSVK
jgi:hypothetical protein